MYNQDILNKITQQQIQNRLKHVQQSLDPSNFNQEQINYKRNYYKDLFALENRLKQFQRNDKIYKDNDQLKKERLLNLIDKRMDLKQKEDQLYEEIKNIQKYQSSPQILNPLQANNYYSTPQISNKASNNFNIFINAGKNASNYPRNQSGIFKNMDLNDFKRMRLLNNQLPLNDAELNQINQNLQKFDHLVNKQPYVNNIMNLKSQNDITSESHVINYLKAQINDLELQCTSLSRNSQYYFDKQRQIDHIKKIISFILNKNPFKPQAEITNNSSDYLNGFHINWDFIKFIPSYVKRVKINYGIFKRESTFFTYRSTSDYYAHHQNYLVNQQIVIQNHPYQIIDKLINLLFFEQSLNYLQQLQDDNHLQILIGLKIIFNLINKQDNTPDRQIAVINEQHVIQSMIIQENVVLYLDLWVWDETDQNLIKYGWSLLDLFDVKGNFLPGKYRIPFYPKEIKAHLLFQNGIKYLSHNCFCYLSIQTSKEHFNFNKQQFDYESEYYIPPLHLKPVRDEIIYQPDSIQIYTSADDMPQVGIFKKEFVHKQKQEPIQNSANSQQKKQVSQSSDDNQITKKINDGLQIQFNYDN